MAYDLHIGSNLDNHKYRVGISEACHFELFSSIQKVSLDLPMILKMEDYFEDAKLSGNELNSLISEIESLRIEFGHSKSILDTLDGIYKTASEAIEKNYVMYGFCD